MEDALKIEIATSIAAIDAAQWDACANSGDSYNPFVSHAFLKALEASKSASPRAGWAPAHVLARSGATLVGAAPTYVKSHSMGEYVFDFGWADAYRRAGLDYYPKIQVASPFTPATGPRLLALPGCEARARPALIGGLRALRGKADASSIHVTFPTREEWEALGAAGFLLRTGQQFHFLNKGYGDFAGFLDDLASRKRKMIRRERRQALAGGIDIDLLTGADIKERHWDAFHEFYEDTGARKWGQPYLTRAFFSMVGEAMPERILLVMARRGTRYVAGAINFIGSDALYGRNWGAIEDVPFLHFEVCYYQAIEFAISRGLARVEAGAQGEHKLARGYGPVPTYSAHEIADPRFARAIGEYLRRERLQAELELEGYATLTPFRRGEATPEPDGF
ncbi:GNAT family N-acetyltransferase [Methylocella sp.]|uniref:GNAT family N-acetyltransferase n=1 Tax=Methylocella sp. TaxID=1978226 RepID=UPI003783DA72